MSGSPTRSVPLMFSDHNIVSLSIFPFTSACFIPPPNSNFILLLIFVILLASAPERFEVCTAVLLKTQFF